jgi:hypothetical protein
MRITASSSSETLRRTGPSVPQRQEHWVATARALVTLPREDPSARIPAHSPRPHAPFVAQLIAATLDMPQSRLRRRAEPDDATAAYAAAMAERDRPDRAVARTM